MPAVKAQPQSESAESSTAKEQARQKIGELKTAKKQSQSKINARKHYHRMLKEKTEQARIPKELREQPLDVEKLRAIAELAKQIQGRNRHG